ncbi:hypothetical protein M513_00125 [Trichuris suis]|uniref:Uncharacterized protein n=1 Tax=Trichuris suis TaxID=68888 RepID=A0A085MP16_9BILA|nr:hypothetical protein M513_00125 [Trichuris suis]
MVKLERDIQFAEDQSNLFPDGFEKELRKSKNGIAKPDIIDKQSENKWKKKGFMNRKASVRIRRNRLLFLHTMRIVDIPIRVPQSHVLGTASQH